MVQIGKRTIKSIIGYIKSSLGAMSTTDAIIVLGLGFKIHDIKLANLYKTVTNQNKALAKLKKLKKSTHNGKSNKSGNLHDLRAHINDHYKKQLHDKRIKDTDLQNESPSK